MGNCKCGSEVQYGSCCAQFISGDKSPDTAEQLMRSRYTAYVIGEIDYIVDTTLPEMKDGINVEATKAWSEDSSWIGLEIHSLEEGSESDDFGYVEFTAKYENLGEIQEHREKAFFKKEDSKWYFVPDARKPIRKVDKVGRNEPCPCGSGKKYKKCCGLNI